MVSQGDIRLERVTGNIGAVVHGLRLGETHPATAIETLRDAVHQFGVLFFEFEQALDASEFRALADIFGEPEKTYALRPTDTDGKADDIDSVMDSNVTPMEEFRTNVWHTDGCPLECPPQTAMLTAVELPEAGGDTMWASMYAAWEGLSSYYQRLLDGMEALQSTVRLPFLDKRSTVHPVAPRDPVTGQTMLYVNSNYTERILDVKDHESEALLRMLFEHVNTPEFHVRLRWRLGTVAVWDERATQHRGVADFSGTRKLRRLTFPGGPLVA